MTHKGQPRQPTFAAILDPRLGDIEDDASSTKRRSMFSLAGSLLVEISLPKLVLAWILLLVLPGLLLGLVPIVVTSWLGAVASKIASAFIGIWSALIFLAVAALGWFGWRTVVRTVEKNFWALNSIVVQPGYAAAREILRHLTERAFAKHASEATRAKLRAAAAAVAGILVSVFAGFVLWLVWPSAHLFAQTSEIANWRDIVPVALANSVVVITAYLAVAALVWGIADAATPQPRGLTAFDEPQEGDRTWRAVHLSDIHIVGERYGFRIESGRSGPRGNDRLKRLFDKLEAIDANDRLDVILITGDMTDAGICTEWAQFFELLAEHPSLAERVLILPGNHDLNIIDRANPARMDLPTSPDRRLRQIRALSAMDAVQGERVNVVDLSAGKLGETLTAFLKPHADAMKRFADEARPLLSDALSVLWSKSFPVVLPPRREDGLGVILLNSNADTHFSFTNALGMVSAEQVRGIEIACAAYPGACWIVALHHHVIEYPWAAKALSERIGTALINGNWFIRKMRPLADRILLMHGHRHVDWIGECAELRIVSAPSPVMEATNDMPTAFYIHTLAIDGEGCLKLRRPERIVLEGEVSGADA
ncbi:MAG: metallophosphoesterase [Methyloceanibacter sp.]|uniref:metallophosphoesterase family protein n=1 Tax=Methyloceanibacter sp. TaxID=1965321 RepID=UPI001D2E3EE0|nr:metallophosphoesterase [Methyloceanibacter sp.]MCB1443170.1 metallophosphoesterase [Methyloceanibacter sp.]MCC0058696.1 metallophosphoesterase [Hyphomicrobiaceae bacterium]